MTILPHTKSMDIRLFSSWHESVLKRDQLTRRDHRFLKFRCPSSRPVAAHHGAICDTSRSDTIWFICLGFPRERATGMKSDMTLT